MSFVYKGRLYEPGGKNKTGASLKEDVGEAVILLVEGTCRKFLFLLTVTLCWGADQEASVILPLTSTDVPLSS